MKKHLLYVFEAINFLPITVEYWIKFILLIKYFKVFFILNLHDSSVGFELIMKANRLFR
jgi:hypothetical protein